MNAKSIRSNDAPEEILYVDIASVSTGLVEQKLAYPFSKAPGRARRVVCNGDIIWSCVRPNRKSYSLILQPEQNLIVSTGFAVLSARKVPYTFLYQAVTTDDFVSYLVNHATGAAYPAASSSTFEEAQVLVPVTKLLSDFDEAVKPMFTEAKALTRKNINLRQTRDLLLPKLISGELDVSDLEIAGAA